MISFKGAHYPKWVITFAVCFYVRYGVSYRDLEEFMRERGVFVDHATQTGEEAFDHVSVFAVV